MRSKPKTRRRLSYEGKITWLALGAVAPALLVALALLWFGGHSSKVQWTLTMLIRGSVFEMSSSARARIVHPLQTLAKLLAAQHQYGNSTRKRSAAEGCVISGVLL